MVGSRAGKVDGHHGLITGGIDPQFEGLIFITLAESADDFKSKIPSHGAL
jgi:hypothetical protein